MVYRQAGVQDSSQPFEVAWLTAMCGLASAGKSSPKYTKTASLVFWSILGYFGASHNRHYVIVGQCATMLQNAICSMLHRGRIGVFSL